LHARRKSDKNRLGANGIAPLSRDGETIEDWIGTKGNKTGNGNVPWKGSDIPVVHQGKRMARVRGKGGHKGTREGIFSGVAPGGSAEKRAAFGTRKGQLRGKRGDGGGETADMARSTGTRKEGLCKRWGAPVDPRSRP